MPAVSVKGAIDIHIHSNPSLMERMHDDIGHARLARDAEMAAICIKSHFEPTVSRGYHAEKHVPEVRVFGGIVLNWTVGGLNPCAVETQIKLGAKIIWMPTMHALAHARKYGLGTYGYQSPGLTVSVTPISVFREGSTQLNEETIAILGLVKQHDVMLGTAHLSPEEIFEVVRAGREIGCQKLVVTHPFFRPPNLNKEQCVKLVEMGAILELTAGNHSPIPGWGNLQLDVETIQAVGADHCIISTDAGQLRKSPPPEELRRYAQCLHEKGISLRDLEVMMIHNNRRLLGME